LALIPAVVFQSWMTSAVAHRYEPGSLVANLDTVFRFDQRQELGLVRAATSQLGAVLALLSMLIGCFAAGGWLQVFLERTHGESLRRFFFGGARYYWRFFRVLLCTIAVLALWSYLVYGAPWNTVVLNWMFHVPKSDYTKLETLASERTVVHLTWARDGVYALGFALVLVWSTYTRTRLALHDTSSAVWAGIASSVTCLRQPLRTLTPFAGLFVLEAVIVLASGVFARKVEGALATRGDLAGVLLLFLIGTLALMWRVALRGARYHAAVAVSREVVRPIARPDPWKESFGGPGGPRYPLGGDEYGMSL
jgi:hypothetical protein